MAAHADTYGRRRLRAASSLLDAHIRWVLVAPAVLLILFMTIYPLGKVLGDSVNIDFTNDHHWYYVSIVLADAWQWTPFMFVILLAGLASISDQLYEAAEIDGASPRQSFFFVTLPLLTPIVLLAV